MWGLKRRFHPGGLGLVALCACGEAELVLLLPAADPEAQSEVVNWGCEDAEPRIHARATEDSAPLLSPACEAGGQVYLWRFRETLAELELASGDLPALCEAGAFDDLGACLHRGLPTPRASFEAELGAVGSGFSAAAALPVALTGLRYRRQGLSLRIVGAERRVGLYGLLALPWDDGRFLLLEERSNQAVVDLRLVTLDDARAGRTSSVPPIGSLTSFSRLSSVVRLEGDELLIASFSSQTRRGPPTGPFVSLTHEGHAVGQLLVERADANPTVYGLAIYSGRVSRLEGEEWRIISDPVPPGPPSCRNPAARAGQDNASEWHQGAGYLVPPSGDEHDVPFPNGMWRVADGQATWLAWPYPTSCVSALSVVEGALTAGTRDGRLYTRADASFGPLDLPPVPSSIKHILPLSPELVLLSGDAGLLGVSDGRFFAAAPPLLTGVAANVKTVLRAEGQLLVITGESDHVHNLIVLDL